MKNKKLLLFFIVLLLTTLPLNVSCSSNDEGAVQAENSSLSAFFLDIGYENCLMCHVGGQVPINNHCKSFNPDYSKILDELYSPSINDCLYCHKGHNIKDGKSETTFYCAICHH